MNSSRSSHARPVPIAAAQLVARNDLPDLEALHLLGHLAGPDAGGQLLGADLLQRLPGASGSDPDLPVLVTLGSGFNRCGS
jgi:hypothetical protein